MWLEPPPAASRTCVRASTRGAQKPAQAPLPKPPLAIHVLFALRSAGAHSPPLLSPIDRPRMLQAPLPPVPASRRHALVPSAHLQLGALAGSAHSRAPIGVSRLVLTANRLGKDAFPRLRPQSRRFPGLRATCAALSSVLKTRSQRLSNSGGLLAPPALPAEQRRNP